MAARLSQVLWVAVGVLALNACDRTKSERGTSSPTGSSSVTQLATVGSGSPFGAPSGNAVAQQSEHASIGMTECRLNEPFCARPLAGAETTIAARFSVEKPFDSSTPLTGQWVSVGPDRLAILVSHAGSSTMPLLLLVNSAGDVGWVRDRPLGGIHDGVVHRALSAGRDGKVLLVFHDVVARVIGARLWDADGTRIADFVLVDNLELDGLRTVYSPSSGWFIAASTHDSIRVQRMDHDGHVLWAKEGNVALQGRVAGSTWDVAYDLEGDVFVTGVTASHVAPGMRSLVVSTLDARGERKSRQPVELTTFASNVPRFEWAMPPHAAGMTISVSEGSKRLLHVLAGGSVVID